jgi:hypothetical protein
VNSFVSTNVSIWQALARIQDAMDHIAAAAAAVDADGSQ